MYSLTKNLKKPIEIAYRNNWAQLKVVCNLKKSYIMLALKQLFDNYLV